MQAWKIGILYGGLCCGGLALVAELRAQAETPTLPDSESHEVPAVNIKTKTLGGIQFWGDVQFFHGWHIQQNVFSKHYRLLDERDVRHAWGTLEECRAKLDEIKRTEKLPPMSGEAVILLHGLGRSDKSMQAMQSHLARQGYYVVNFNYPSTRVSLDESADYLHGVIESLEGIDKIHFVPFSMGGLVVRTYLSEHRDPRIGRMVMVGVPNLGADLASSLQHNWAYKLLIGPAGQQLIAAENGFAKQLPIPEFDFAIIAGERGNEAGYNPLIPGDDDGTVSVECTRLPGADDFLTIRTIHPFLTKSPTALECTVRFLKEGRLRAEGERQPIPVPALAADDSPAAKAP
jgi:pimeloyl-ACP methyl ester carboxylesterase